MISKKLKIIITIIACIIVATCLIRNHIELKNREITFQIDKDAASFSSNGDDLICLTSDGRVITYDKNGKEKVSNQTEVKYISEIGELLIIKNNGSIISNIDEELNGDIIGNIPGAKSGFAWRSMAVIVTESGELYFHTDIPEIQFDFQETEEIDGWVKVKDISNVKKAYISGTSDFRVLYVLTNDGDLYATATQYFFRGCMHNISESLRIDDISISRETLLMIDDHGNTYQVGGGIFSRSSYYDTVDKIDQLTDVKEISTGYYQGAVITTKEEILVWNVHVNYEGKSCDETTLLGRIPDDKWENLIISNYLYLIKGSFVKRIDYKKAVKFYDFFDLSSNVSKNKGY